MRTCPKNLNSTKKGLILVFVSVLCLAGCNRANHSEAPIVQSTNESRIITEAAGTELRRSDANLAEEIRANLQSDLNNSAAAANLQISQTDGKVVVRGAVKTAEAKNTLEARIKKMIGTNVLDSRLEISPGNLSVPEVNN